LIDRGVDCPKILIYCHTQLLVGYLYEQFLLNILENGNSVNHINRKKLIAMFHADTDETLKENVLASLTGDVFLQQVHLAVVSIVKMFSVSFILDHPTA
jgi:hypothetical protein